MYADLCERIARTPIPGLGEDPSGKDSSKGSKKFRKMLLVKVQQEFQKDWQGLFAAVQVREDSFASYEYVDKCALVAWSGTRPGRHLINVLDR